MAEPVESQRRSAGDVRDPVAIVGIGCRFPGGIDSPDSLWRALVSGLDAIEEIPPDRFDAAALYHEGPHVPGSIASRWGGFLKDIDRFDADFFGIAPREAERLDPQQRLLLETAWEAVEDAGIPAGRLAGTRTGVFAGVMLGDFEGRLLADPAADFYMTTGSGRYAISGRLSYALGLQGPALTLDTGCSSSLVAVHLACRSLWSGESELALAGGANVILLPYMTVAYSQSSMMARDGRCKFGDVRGDGYVRSEGAAMLLLKPLSRALADGDPIHAVIRGTAANNDGRSGAYMATPAREGQEQVLRLAYRDAEVSPGRVAYVEAHGTGTAAGDPVELGALGAVLGEGRSPGDRCAVGSIKTNIGHTEGAAGVAGLIKAALVLREGAVPPSLHLERPREEIPWDDLPLHVPRELTPLRRGGAPLLAGVSSFGIAGTNAHAVLEEAPREATRAGAPEPRPTGPVLLPLSARSPAALAKLAGAWVSLLERGDAPPLGDLAYSAGCRRTHLEERVAVVAGDAAELKARLASFAAGEVDAGVARGRAAEGRRKVVFVFPGQGSQWEGMVRELLDGSPVFRETMEACEAAMRPHVDGWSLLEQLSLDPEVPGYALGRIDVVQPVLVAVDVALAAVWRSWGVEPDAVVGHSMGEVAAAHVAGALSLEDACRVVCLRSRLMRRTSGRGLMAVTELTLEEAGALLAGREGRVSVAAANGPTSTVLSGDPDAVREVLALLEAREVFGRLVNVDVASHSPQMEPLCAELEAGLQELEPRPARVPMYSTVTGGPVDGATLGADYWKRNLRQPVLFAGAVESLLSEGHDTFLEASPHPVLLAAVEDTARAAGREVLTLPSLRRREPERATLLGGLGELFAAGYPVDFHRLHPRGGRVVRLPRYPWQRERFWYEPASAPRAAVPAGGHPLLGRAFRSATGAVVWEGELSTASLPWLSDHRVRGRAVLPAAAYVEMALAAAAETLGSGASISQMSFEEALFLEEDGAVRVQVVVDPEGEGAALLKVLGRRASAEEGVPWTLHARATLLRGGGRDGVPVDAAASGRPAVRERAEDHYAAMAARGLDYGPAFRGIGSLWRGAGGTAAGAEIALPSSNGAGGEESPYRVHPALLDAAFQVLLQTSLEGGSGDAWLPASLERFELVRRPRPGESLRAWAIRRNGSGEARGDVHVLGEDGEPVAWCRGLRLERVASGAESGWLFRTEWVDAPRAEEAPEAGGARSWLVLADGGGTGDELAARIEALGGRAVTARAAGAFASQGPGRFTVDPTRPDDFVRLLAEASAVAGPLEGVAHLWSLDAGGQTPAASSGAAQPSDAADLGPVAVLHVVQALAAAAQGSVPRLCLVTAGGQAVLPGEAPRPEQALVWGMAGVLANEHPELCCASLDLEPGSPAASLDALLRELRHPDREDRVAFRGGRRLAARLIRHDAPPAAATPPPAAATPPPAAATPPPAPAEVQAYRVVTTSPGRLDALVPRASYRVPPGPGQVEIEVRACGLNFMNVMSALGIYPGQPGGVGPLGIECAGVVVRVGEGVEDFRAGDGVVAYAPGSLASHVLADHRLVAPMPPGIEPAEAATLPIAFLTAHYGLHHLARLEAGERVLVHSATGGVGLAALQLARAAGARVLATAGSEAKRAYLRELGVEDVFDSRSLSFADGVLERTGGEGVDVVLNSLAGAAIARGLGVLAPYGRFVEIGKKDIYEDVRIGLAPFRKNLSYFAVDLERAGRERPELLGGMLRELMDRVGAGDLAPLPLTTFPMAEVGEAFRHMAQARHVGKVVVRVQGTTELADGIRPPDSAVRPDGTYLITGGLGGLGLEVARWLVREGARSLVLVGRGAPSPAAAREVERIGAAGVEVRVARADVASRDQLGAVLEEVDGSAMPPLRGVIHAAGLLSDGLVLGMERERFRSALPPKVEGARNLHELTKELPLDFFVLFSSAAAVLGTPGQANYAAANAFMDALAHARRSRGLPALSVNWGPWSEVGLAAARGDRGERLAGQGLASLAPEEGIRALAKLLAPADGAGREAQVAVMRFEPAAWCRAHSAAAAAPFLEDLTKADGAPPEETAPVGGILEALEAADFESDRRTLLEGYLRERAAQVLRLAPARVAVDRPLKTLGLDSLMTLELRNRLEPELGIPIPATTLFNYPTVSLLADHLGGRLGGPTAPRRGHREEPAETEETQETREPPPPTSAQRAGAAPEGRLSELESLLADELSRVDDLLGS